MDSSLPLLTSDLPGCAGLVKAVPEDFEVEEVPAYLPSGEGEHLYLWVEKRGLSTPEAARLLASHLGIPEREVSYAGLKDRQALSRQTLCVPAKVEAKLAGFAHPKLRLLSQARHGNKLRTGHLRGNRFRIRIREVQDPGAAQETLERLRAQGAPNYFGEQRFGRAEDNAELGRKLLLGERLDPPPDRFRRRLYLSAFQSRLFNRALAERLRAGSWARALLGDVLEKSEGGGQFLCLDPAVDQPRVERFEVSPAGPLFGPKMLRAQGEVGKAEERLLVEEGVRLEDFARGKGETEGARRPYRVRLADAELSAEGADLWLSLALPRGSYATVVLAELLK